MAFDRRQLMALCFVFSLAPLMRLIPKYSAAEAGGLCWLTPVFALLPTILYIAFLARLLRSGGGMAEYLLRTGGRIPLFFVAANALFYGGFILRSGADRFISGIYTAAEPTPFILVMLVLGLLAALGAEKALVRTAKIFAPMLAAVLVTALLFSLTTVEFENLRAPGIGLAELLRGVLPAFDIAVGVLFYASFFEGDCAEEPHRVRAYSLAALLFCLLLTLDSAAICGNYGASLTASLTHPFFTMLRDVKLFGSIERIEAFVVALWVIPDFVVYSVALKTAVKCLSPGKSPSWLPVLCALVTAAVAFSLPDSNETMQHISSVIVPAANLLTAIGIPLLSLTIGKLRGG